MLHHNIWIDGVFNPFTPESIVETCNVGLTFESVCLSIERVTIQTEPLQQHF